MDLFILIASVFNLIFSVGYRYFEPQYRFAFLNDVAVLFGLVALYLH